MLAIVYHLMSRSPSLEAKIHFINIDLILVVMAHLSLAAYAIRLRLYGCLGILISGGVQ